MITAVTDWIVEGHKACLEPTVTPAAARPSFQRGPRGLPCKIGSYRDGSFPK